MTTVPGTPVHALARAIGEGTSPDDDTETIARAIHAGLIERGWHLVKVNTTVTDDDHPGDVADGAVSPGSALAHVITMHAMQTDAPELGSAESGALLDSHLASLNWHVVHTGPGEMLQVVDANQGFATFPRGDRAVILPASSTEPELAALSAMVDMLDGHDPGTQARMARYLADRYAGGPPEAQ